MLNYIIALSIFSFCHRMTSSQLHNDVSLVVISQRSPVTAYKMLEETLLVVRSTEQVASFFKKFGRTLMRFNANRLIISVLMGLNSSNQSMKHCTGAIGNTLRYDDSTMTDDFKNNLKKKYWPSLLCINEPRVWQIIYENYGSCVNDSAEAYYQNAIDLHDTYNVGGMLERSSIHPDDTISYNGLVGALVGQLGVSPFVKCKIFGEDRSNDQFLHEVSICLNTTYNLVDCPILGEDFCARNKDIIYATWADVLQ